MRVKLIGGYDFQELGVRLAFEGHRSVEAEEPAEVTIFEAGHWRKEAGRSIGASVWGDRANLSEKYADALFFLGEKKPPVMCGGWWRGGKWKLPFRVLDFQDTFMPQRVGPKLVMGISIEWTTEAQSCLQPFEKVFVDNSYEGPVLLLGNKTIVGITLPLLAMLAELQAGRVGSVLLEDEIPLKDRFACGARVCSLPFPALPVSISYTVDEGAAKHIWPTTGGAWVTARGATLDDARRRVYKTIHTISSRYPEIMYRTDVGRARVPSPSSRPSSQAHPVSSPPSPVTQEALEVPSR